MGKILKKVEIGTKLIMIGDGAVGKTSIVRRYLKWGFQERYLPTLGANFYTEKRTYTYDEDQLTVKWTLWDISGQPAFSEVRDKYYIGAKGALVVYDITRKETAENTENWIEELHKRTENKQPVVLLGNKVDLRGTEREEVSSKEGKQLAEDLSEQFGVEIPYIDTSAKTGKNLDKAFKTIAKQISDKLGVF